MTILKLKAMFYRLTGIYLAHREENDYVDSVAYWKEYVRLRSHPESDMSPRSCHGLLIGLWQANHGFARPYKRGLSRKWKKKLTKLRKQKKLSGLSTEKTDSPKDTTNE